VKEIKGKRGRLCTFGKQSRAKCDPRLIWGVGWLIWGVGWLAGWRAGQYNSAKVL